MRVKGVTNRYFIKDQLRSLIKESNESEEVDLPVSLDKEYLVYGMTVKEDYVWYYIADELYNYYPRKQCSILFDVVDNKLSRYWVYSFRKNQNYIKAIPMWAYPEWAEYPDYYDKLTDGDEKEVKIWESYKLKMELEFSDPIITLHAQIGDESWLICPECFGAWLSTDTLDALVLCPKCNLKLNNPRYNIQL